MPISTFMGLHTSLRGLLAEQRALDVTSHNVANANTPGYSRQEAQLQATDALAMPTGDRLGTGVDVVAYKRIRDSFLDLQFRAQNMQVGAGATRADGVDQAELRLSEPSDNGLAARLNSFWGKWADLANAPDSGAAKQALISDAKTLVSSVNALDQGLQTVSSQSAAELGSITATGGQLQQIGKELAGLNGAIRDTQRVGGDPNDLLDRRDVLLDQLSSLAQVSVADDGAGSINVTVGGAGAPLVSGSALTWPPPAMSASPGGKIGALMDLSSPTGTIATFRADLANVAQTLTTQVNAIYNPAAGADFFAYDPLTATLSLNPAVTAASVRAGSGAASDNGAALALSELRGATGGADDLYSRFVTRMGTEVADARRTTQNASALSESISDRRQSTAGVSLDEEMTNLIRFQRGYQAAARAMSTTDTMLDTLINRTGRVGL